MEEAAPGLEQRECTGDARDRGSYGKRFDPPARLCCSRYVSQTDTSEHRLISVDLRIDKEERILEIYDPGSGVTPIQGARESMPPSPHQGLLNRTWDEVCANFASINLNWDPQKLTSTAIRHW